MAIAREEAQRETGTQMWPRSGLGWACLHVVLLVVCLWIGFSLGKLLVPSNELLVDLQAVSKGRVRVALPYQNGTVLEATRDAEGHYGVRLPDGYAGGQYLALEISDSPLRVTGARLGEASLSGGDLIPTHVSPNDRFDYTVLRLPTQVPWRTPVSIGVTVLLFGILAAASRQIAGATRSWRTVISKAVYSPAVFAHLRPLDLGLTVAIFLVTALVVVGTDAWSSYTSMRLAVRGIDVYQFQVALKPLTHFVYAPWPYNPPMTLFWSAVVGPWDLLTGNLPHLGGFPYFQIAGMKLANWVLLTLTVLALLSFAIEQGLLKTRVRWMYYLALFNPVTFYVAMLFVQFDTLPLYLMTLGIVLMRHPERDGRLAAFLLAAALSMKLQMFVLFPPLALLVALALLSEKVSWGRRVANGTSLACIMLATMGVLFVAHYVPGTAFHDLLSHFEQKERIWYTGIPYAPGLTLFLAPFGVMLFAALNLLFVHSRLTRDQIVLNALLSVGALTCIFSAGIISTPSSFLHVLPAFVALFLLNRDRLTQLLTAGMSSLIVLQVALTDVGDITRLLGWQRAIIAPKIGQMAPQALSHYSSVLFTLSVTGLVLFALLFLVASIHVLLPNRQVKPADLLRSPLN